VVCSECGGALKLFALIKTEATIATLISALGIAIGPPGAPYNLRLFPRGREKEGWGRKGRHG
jgi:hypothetical protein